MAEAVAADYDAVREPCMQDWEVMDIEHYHTCRRLGILAQWESPRKELTGNRGKKREREMRRGRRIHNDMIIKRAKPAAELVSPVPSHACLAIPSEACAARRPVNPHKRESSANAKAAHARCATTPFKLTPVPCHL